MLQDVLFVEFNERNSITDKAHCAGCDVLETTDLAHCCSCESVDLTVHAHCEGCQVN